MKKNTTHVIISMLLVAFTISSCKKDKKENQEDSENIEMREESGPEGITLVKLEGSPACSDAVLEMNAPASGKLPAGETDFSFTVNNYELGAQTTGPNTTMLANSGKGQHIHFILNRRAIAVGFNSLMLASVSLFLCDTSYACIEVVH